MGKLLNGVDMHIPDGVSQVSIRDIPQPTMNGIPLSPDSFTLMTMDVRILMAGQSLKAAFMPRSEDTTNPPTAAKPLKPNEVNI